MAQLTYQKVPSQTILPGNHSPLPADSTSPGEITIFL